MKSFRLGLYAEYLVLIWYKLLFYKIIHHRKRTCAGEVDIIAVRGKQLLFIEVKARTKLNLENIVTHRQQQRIRRAAGLFLSQNSRLNSHDIRFDLAVIVPYKLPIIIKNAW